MSKYETDEKKLNVLMMVSWYGPRGEHPSGGVFHYEMAQEIGKTCNCAIYYPYDREVAAPFEKCVDWGITTYRSKYNLADKFKNRLYMYKTMKYIVEDFKPDIIHGNVATEAGRFATVLGKIFGIPVVISEHSSAEYSGVDKFPHNLYARIAYGMSKYNTCVSDHLNDRLSELFPKYTFHTVYNGIKNPANVIKNNDEQYRVKDTVNIGIVAGFYDEKIKGMQNLLPVIKRVKEDNKKIMLHIIGGGTFLEKYKKYAEELGISDCTLFYGRVEKQKVFEIASEMDFMVSASLIESFGCSIAEGAMLGKPAVGTRCGGLESIINDNNGILVNVNDQEDLYRGINKMLESYSSYDSEIIASEAKDKFLISSVANQYIEIYKKVLSR